MWSVVYFVAFGKMTILLLFDFKTILYGPETWSRSKIYKIAKQALDFQDARKKKCRMGDFKMNDFGVVSRGMAPTDSVPTTKT